MTGKELYDEATVVGAEDGKVLLDGPDGVDVALTPEAAIETAERLTTGASEAAGQRHFREQDKQAERYDEQKGD